MSDVVAELATRWQVSDPRPAHCSGCFCGSDSTMEFFTPDVSIDRGSFVDQNGAMGILDSIDELHLCAQKDDEGRIVGGCVAQLLDVAAYKPRLHSRQFNEIQRLELAVEHWKSYARRLEATLQDRPEPAPRARKQTRRG